MKKTKFSHKVIAVFLTINFLSSILPVNSLFASNNGPGSPEAAGFEPVDATDMVSLTTGDLSYVLPLMSVEGFPVNLSYHAGMSTDMDASWVGLGWYLNPGAINRTVTNTPDDIKDGIGINFNSYYNQEAYYGITIDLGFPSGASVGVGLNWGGGQALSGSVNASIHSFKLGEMVKGGASASVSASTTGDASASVGYGYSLGSVGGGASISYSLKNQWSISGGVGVKVADNTYLGMGMSSSGGFGVGMSAGSVGSGDKQINGSAGVGMSSSSFSSGDASVDTQSTGVAIPLHAFGIPLTLGFSQTKVKINIRKAFKNHEWGALYAGDYNDFTDTSDGLPQIYNTSYSTQYLDYAKRTNSLDTYSTRLPQSEEEFIGDYSKDIENINFTFMGYDDYNVAAQGVMGSMTPHVFHNATIFGKGERTKNVNDDDIHIFWHYGQNSGANKNAVQRTLGNPDNYYDDKDFYFNFNGQFTNNEKNDIINLNPSNINSSNDINDLINEGTHNGFTSSNTYGRAKSPNYVEVFTNQEIADGDAQARGLITPANMNDNDRDNLALFDPNGIGAYKINSPDGKAYHFSLPVYHFEQIHRGLINKQEDNNFNIGNVNEKRQYSRYATHWLLTAITGSDYVDRPDPSLGNSYNTFNKEDYGYWVELEYGKWSDGFVWRSPYQDKVYDYKTNLEDNIADLDKGSYSFGRKQIYYLDKINTKNRTALFVKDIRYDAIGKNLKFQYSNVTTQSLPVVGNWNQTNGEYLDNTGDGAIPNSLKYTRDDIYVREWQQRTDGRKGVEYEREYTLRLKEIILVDSEVGKNLSKNSSPNLNHGGLYSNYSPNSYCVPNWESEDFRMLYDSNYPNFDPNNQYSYVIHNEQDVLDVNDIPSNLIADNALKVVELGHSYQLAQNSPSSIEAPPTTTITGEQYGNSNKGRLTLESVKIKGKGGTDYMPATTFNYYLENMQNVTLTPVTGSQPNIEDIKAKVIEKRALMDSWGFLQGVDQSTGENKVKAWSLKDITMPTGAKIEIDYEEDDYYTEAFSRRYWTEHLAMKFEKITAGQEYKMYIQNHANLNPDNQIDDFNKYFEVGERVFLDLWFCHKDDSHAGNERGWINIKEDDYVTVESISVNSHGTQILTLKILDTGIETLNGCPGYGDCRPNNVFNKWIDDEGSYGFDGPFLIPCSSMSSDVPTSECPYGKYSTNGENVSSYRGNCTGDSGRDDYNLIYRLLANKVPENETGGGLRVKELRTISDGRIYKAQYDYNHPIKNRSSGITSYAPIDGLKFVPYQSEVPAPGVMYEYVTMKETSNNDEFTSKTRYRHHVLKPVHNIFNPNIRMEALDADASGEDQIFWANVSENHDGFDGNNSMKIEAKKIDINVNTAILGQVKSMEVINNEGHVIAKTENEYINGAILAGEKPNKEGNYNDYEQNKGVVKETFNSMKTVFKTNGNGTTVQDAKKLLSISSKTEYNNMIKKTISTTGGQKTWTEYSNVDPWLGSFRDSKTTLSDGSVKYDSRFPAYTKYPDMESKVLNPSNKNMLSQEAMSTTIVDNYVLNASIDTWKDTWTYRDNNGNESTESGIWRKHKSFVWKDDINPITGTYQTTVSNDISHFNWGTGTPTNSKWQNVSEITRYTHWSTPLEMRDINNNFASSKLADNSNKVIASGNSRYTEMYYSGAEYVSSGNTFEGEVNGANFRTDEVAHTGTYSVKNDNANDKVFSVSGQTSSDYNDLSQDFRPGKYKVSFWSHNQIDVDYATLKLNGSSISVSETVEAGCWKQFNYYVDIQPNTSFDISVTNTIRGGFYFDDFRMHPVYASMSSFVYDLNSDELLYILDTNNMASAFRYDDVGRLKATYQEVENTDIFDGGFKIISQYNQHYRNTVSATSNYNEDINNCITQSFDPLKLKGLVAYCTPQYNPYDIQYAMHVYGGSGNYKYEWQYLTDIDTNQYTNWYQGGDYEFIPYENKYCSENTFDKVWFVKAKVTDLVTGEIVKATSEYASSSCPGYIINPKLMLGVEASYCHGNCGDSKYKFHLYPLDSSLALPDNSGYLDNNNGVTYGVDLTKEDGLFCPEIKYVESSSCKSGYIEYVSISPFHEGSTNYTYDFYLNCVSEKDVDLNSELIIGASPDPKYASPGILVIKEDGKIISVIDTNKKQDYMGGLRYYILVLAFVSGLWTYGQELPPEPAVDTDQNWTSSISYDLMGNTLGKGVSYFNGLGKGTQSQSWDLLTDKVWASQVLYDAQGRPVLSTLSAPIGTSFGINETDFILDQFHSTYDLSDFDIGGMVDDPSRVSANSKLGSYYHYNTNDEFQDNTIYPFSRTVYSELNPGAVKKTLGGNKVNGDWLQGYSFSMPAAQELSNSRAFGSSSYNDDRITKTVSRDVNGVETVVFIDGDGNTLAAARSGNEEDPSLGQYYMISTINEQGFVDIHVPVGCSGVTVLNNPTGSSLKVYDLITEQQIFTSPESLVSGVYRFAVNDVDAFEYDENDEVRLRYYVNYYDYALNTYDKAGRLLTSTQPLGDELESTYKYNSLGQLLEATSPDEGTSRFKYRKDGQIRFSQNSKQALLGEVSFTDYDDLGRPIRSGVGVADFDMLDPDTSIISNQLSELHETLYDEPDPGLLDALTACGIDEKLYRQTFLYGNVSMTFTDQPFTGKSWYSYDVYGRLKWLVQEIAELDCVKTINYSYDPLTGQVTSVDYQRHSPNERFVHKYEYNAAGQLIVVSTSRNGTDYTENARYYYTETGVLRRTEIAENLQGIDYVYNINGQLKAINSPLNAGFKDPGNDSPGTNGFMPDVFGMILDYHDQDFIRNASNLNGLKNNGVSSQYNGNIASMRWNNDTPAAATADSYTYSYNKNNWLTQANFGTTTTTNGNSTFSADTNGDYKVDNITYDANGNITTLTRNGVTNGSGSNDMDEFTYHYKDGNNQLTAVEDTNDNADPARYDDLRNQYITTTVSDPFGGDLEVQSQENYIYNSIGQLETNVQDQISYEYNASGLVTQINGFTDSNTGEWSTIYNQDFTTVTLYEQSYWTVEEGNASINFNNYNTNLSTWHCEALQNTYGNSFGIMKTPGTFSQTPGQMSGRRDFTVLDGKLHQISLDVIAKQVEHQRLERFDPNNPPPPVVLADNPMGYKIEVLDENDQVLTTTSYNTPNPVMIDDPTLNDIEPCSKYYTNGHSLQFTPSSDKVALKVTVYYDANVPGAVLYLDNIKIEVAEAPKVAFFYNDRGHRVRKESYDDNGNTFRTIYVRDVAGSPLAIYDEASGPTVQQAETLKELPVYGASRLGIYYRDNNEGTYAYQLSDHLGNVRAVIIRNGENTLSLTNKTDYYPFGMAMPDRNVEGNYRYGYQGEYAEKDPETGKNAFQLRLWDSRIGRWMSPDPYGQFASPYLGMGNNPINGVDPDGGCWDKDGNPCPDGKLGDVTTDYLGTEWTFGKNGWDTNAFDNYTVDLGTVDLSDLAYWRDVNALAVNLNKQLDLKTGKSAAIRAREEQERIDNTPIYGYFEYQQPEFNPPLIHPFDLLSGGGTFAIKNIFVLTKFRYAEKIFRTTIRFGKRGTNQVHHATRHILDAGLNVNSVKSAVRRDIQNNAHSLLDNVGDSVRRTVTVKGVEIEYRAFKLSDEIINVGTMFPKQ